MFSSCVFFMLNLFPTFLEFFGNIEKLNGRWLLQIVDIGNFNMKLNVRWFPQIVDTDSRNVYPIYIYRYIQQIVVLASEPVGGDLGRPSCLVWISLIFDMHEMVVGRKMGMTFYQKTPRLSLLIAKNVNILIIFWKY